MRRLFGGGSKPIDALGRRRAGRVLHLLDRDDATDARLARRCSAGASRCKPGQTYSVADLVRRLTTLGYRREPLVQGRGEFSLRGGILDCFPPDRRRPLRSEFFGDELESLREFEVESQGSVGDIAAARILPAAEAHPDA